MVSWAVLGLVEQEEEAGGIESNELPARYRDSIPTNQVFLHILQPSESSCRLGCKAISRKTGPIAVRLSSKSVLPLKLTRLTPSPRVSENARRTLITQGMLPLPIPPVQSHHQPKRDPAPRLIVSNPGDLSYHSPRRMGTPVRWQLYTAPWVSLLPTSKTRNTRCHPPTKLKFVVKIGVAAHTAGLEPPPGNCTRIGPALEYLLRGRPIQCREGHRALGRGLFPGIMEEACQHSLCHSDCH